MCAFDSAVLFPLYACIIIVRQYVIAASFSQNGVHHRRPISRPTPLKQHKSHKPLSPNTHSHQNSHSLRQKRPRSHPLLLFLQRSQPKPLARQQSLNLRGLSFRLGRRLRALLDNRVDADQYLEPSGSPLVSACRDGNVELATFLLNPGSRSEQRLLQR